MQTYRCKIRLANHVNNEVAKNGVTAAEVMCLRKLHGDGAVLDVRPIKMDKRSHDEERDRLVRKYGQGTVTALFGNAFQKLPGKLSATGKPTADEGMDAGSTEAAGAAPAAE